MDKRDIEAFLRKLHAGRYIDSHIIERAEKLAGCDFIQASLEDIQQGQVKRGQAKRHLVEKHNCSNNPFDLDATCTLLDDCRELIDAEPNRVIVPPETKKTLQGTLKSPVAVENAQEAEKSDFMIFLKVKNKKAYNAMKKALGKWVLYENEKLDFRCKIGTVGQFFLTADFIEQEDREIIAEHITIFGESTTADKLKNAYGNSPPGDWKQMEKEIFNTAEYM
ncbi:hypothetical protein FACS1894137_04140 [Spirochaetia bacterium]|nr:hypothetical protein FACS1894137_04140 [Spirochaetia bacterium]